MPASSPPPDPAAPGPPPRESAGLIEGLRETLRAALHHAHLRWALFGLEAAEAAGHLRSAALAAAVAVIGSSLGYVTGWAVVVLWAARRWAGGDLLPPLAVMAGVHLLAALGALWWLVARGRSRDLFAASRAEFAEDQKWLHHQKQ